MSGPHPIYQDATNAVLVGCLTRLGWSPEQFAYQYVAIADSPVPVREPVHPFGWFAEDELDGLPMFEDTRLLARALFPGSARSMRRPGTTARRCCGCCRRPG